MLELRNVHAGYGSNSHVLNDVTIRVPAGVAVALLGANGSGKTTTLRVASRLLDVSSGSVMLDGQDVSTLKPEQLARLGVCHIPEGRGIFPSLTVEDNLLIFARNRGRDQLVEEAVSAFPPLQPLMRRVAGTLSGGQQQMLALCRAYLCDARVALLDELSMGLAPIIVQEIFRFIPRLLDRGTSLLIVEQYVSQALRLADSVYVLSKGSVVFEGSPRELGDSNDLIDVYLGKADEPQPEPVFGGSASNSTASGSRR